MTRDEIISMAREAGARVFGGKIVIADNASSGDGSDFVPRFAALVEAHVREECAKACDAIEDQFNEMERRTFPELKTDAATGAGACSYAVRAGAEKETT